MSVSFLVRKEVVVQRKTNEQADKRWLFCLINDSIDFHDCLPRVDLQILFCPWTIWTWSLDWRPTDIGLEESCSNTLQQLTKTEIDCELVANRPALPSPRGWIEPADLRGSVWKISKFLYVHRCSAATPRAPPREELLGQNQDVVTEKTGSGLLEKINKCNAVQM